MYKKIKIPMNHPHRTLYKTNGQDPDGHTLGTPPRGQGDYGSPVQEERPEGTGVWHDPRSHPK